MSSPFAQGVSQGQDYRVGDRAWPCRQVPRGRPGRWRGGPFVDRLQVGEARGVVAGLRPWIGFVRRHSCSSDRHRLRRGVPIRGETDVAVPLPTESKSRCSRCGSSPPTLTCERGRRRVGRRIMSVDFVVGHHIMFRPACSERVDGLRRQRRRGGVDFRQRQADAVVFGPGGDVACPSYRLKITRECRVSQVERAAADVQDQTIACCFRCDIPGSSVECGNPDLARFLRRSESQSNV